MDNTFTVKAISNLDDEYVPESVQTIVCAGPTVSDSLAGEIERWMEPGADPVLVHAPTGAGKNYFVENSIIPAVLKMGGTMLIASNRIAAATQQKRRVMKLLQDPRVKHLTKEGIRATTDFGPIKIMTLQALGSFMHAEREWCEKASVIVVDEAHFFTSDAMFNHDTGAILYRLVRVFCRALRVYLTATPQDILVPLAEIESANKGPLIERLGIAGYSYRPRNLIMYCFPADYSDLHLRYYRQDEDLMKAIWAAPSNERWLIYVSSIQRGENFRDRLRAEFGPGSACLITANDKGSNAWWEMVESEELSHRVTLATSVIDCGVNIKDPALQHIVIGALDKTTFIQFLGRKRRTAGDSLTLYVPKVSESQISRLRKGLDEKLEIIKMAEEGREDERRALLYRLWASDDAGLRALIRPPVDGKIKINGIAAHKVRRDSYHLRSLEASLNDECEGRENAFPRLVHQWLPGCPEFCEQNWLHWECQVKFKASLSELLASHVGTSISTEEGKSQIRDAILETAKALGIHKGRNDRTLDNRALTNILHDVNLPFLIEKKSGAWIIKERGEEIDDGNEEVEQTCEK